MQLYWSKDMEQASACSPLIEAQTHPDNNVPIVYVLVRGDCPFSTKVKHAEKAG